jgi:hypothetical protein
MAKNGTRLTAAQELHVQRLIEADKNPAFEGTLEFTLVLEFLHQRHPKICRVVYAYTPEWDYCDPHTGEIRSGVDSMMYHVDIQAVPELLQKRDGSWKLGKPYWKRFDDFIADDVLSHDMQDSIIDAIDLVCRDQDADRRKAAGLS